MRKIAISVGDINGIGVQLLLENHKKISSICYPIYCINKKLLKQACKLLNMKLPRDIIMYETKGNFKIKSGKVCKKSGKFSYDSFYDAIGLAKNKEVDAICTMPINKQSWNKAGINYVGHTDMLRDIFKKDAIMMLGCDKLFTVLFTEHISLKNVAKEIKTKKLTQFLLSFKKCINTNNEKIAVLGLNPHAGDGGVLGNEEKSIKKAIKKVNKKHGDVYELVVPDIAFTKSNRKKYRYFICMYHDQGLAPLKALYFEESINVSLNLPITRSSVDHGTAFDIAYKKNNSLNNKSYLNAIDYLLNI